jgi:3',5'-cyclic AMP phosphodiesterase CpdA
MFRRILLPATLLTLAAVGAYAQPAGKLVGGPYVVRVGPDRATVAWVLEFTEGGKSVLHAQKLTISGLTPGKTYHYDVLGKDEGKGYFKSAPDGASRFRFAIFGDTRSRHEVHQNVVNALAKAEPDFVLHTGDLVADGSKTEQWPVFFGIERDLLRKTAFFPALGNHERNDPRFYEFFDIEKPYYSFRWGGAYFVVLNSDLGNMAGNEEDRKAFWTEQSRWLEAELVKSQEAGFRFVVFHHPPITAVKRRQGEKHPVQEWMPLLEKYKVTAVFNGHDHNYQHHIKNGVHYIVTGGGGAPLYEVDSPVPGVTQAVEKIEHFVIIEVDGREARLEAKALDGRLIERIDFKR